MTNYEFALLEEAEKYKVIFEQGTYLDRIIVDGQDRLLYSVSNFYVELTYDDNKDDIKILRTFKNIGQLDPYL